MSDIDYCTGINAPLLVRRGKIFWALSCGNYKAKKTLFNSGSSFFGESTVFRPDPEVKCQKKSN